jgi:hypothetical protein
VRCELCNKFVATEDQIPTVASLSIETDGRMTSSVRIVLCCAECGIELKEATLDLSDDISPALEGHLDGDRGEHRLKIENSGVEWIERKIGPKTYFGTNLKYCVSCSCRGLQFENSMQVMADLLYTD